MKIFRIAYNTIYLGCCVVGLPYLVFRYLRKKKYRQHLTMRLGLYPRALKKAIGEKPFIWFHAVSLGEVISTVPLIGALLETYRDHRVLLTTTTPSGYEVAHRIFAETEVLSAYFPLDFFFMFNPLFRRRKPTFAVFIETEFWPNSILLLRSLKVPIFLANGRISDTSYIRYRSIQPWFGRMLDFYELCFMQSGEDAEKIIALGKAPSAVEVPGNLKYEACLIKSPALPKDAQRARLGIGRDRTVLIGGSTHPGEEEILARLYIELREQHPQLSLILAPRHIERTPEIEEMMTQKGLESRRLSKINAGGPKVPIEKNAVLLVDTIGDLFNVYEAADIVFVGKSLTARGGQNMIEPAVLGKALIFGPYTENFKNASTLLMDNRAAITVNDEHELHTTLRRLLNNPAEIETLGREARKTFESHSNTARAISTKINARMKELTSR